MSDTHGHSDDHGSGHGEVATNIIPETSIQDVILKGIALSTMVIFGFIGFSWTQFPYAEAGHSGHGGSQHAAPGEHKGLTGEHGGAATGHGATTGEHTATPETPQATPAPAATETAAPATAPATTTTSEPAAAPTTAPAAPPAEGEHH